MDTQATLFSAGTAYMQACFHLELHQHDLRMAHTPVQSQRTHLKHLVGLVKDQELQVFEGQDPF